LVLMKCRVNSGESSKIKISDLLRFKFHFNE
jgi:hypothetical protein